MQEQRGNMSLQPRNEHVHEWVPAWDLGMARYRCACGIAAYRNRAQQITPYMRNPYRPVRERTLRFAPSGALPNLDDYDRGRRT